MVDIIDRALKSSNDYNAHILERSKKPATLFILLIIGIIVVFFFLMIYRTPIDTTPNDTIEISPNLETAPGQDSPTGRVKSIPKSPETSPTI